MTDDFQRFWLIWRDKCRKTDGRGKARPAWDQMMQLGYDPSDIIDGATWYLRNLSERDAPYIPLAASWLRSERWADDCELERAYQQRLQEIEARKPVPKQEIIPDTRTDEDRAASVRRVYERLGLPLPHGVE